MAWGSALRILFRPEKIGVRVYEKDPDRNMGGGCRKGRGIRYKAECEK